MYVMKYFLLAVFSILFTSIANAESIEKILLKDGSVLEGHIVSQVPGKTLTFYSEVSTIVLSGNYVNILGSVEDEIGNNSDEWIKWGNEHKDALIHKSGKSYLKLTDISINTYNSNKDSSKDVTSKNVLLKYATSGRVKILMRGENVKYVDVSKKEYSISYKDIAEIQKVLRKKDVISGTIDIIETTGGKTLSGQIVTQKLGQSVQILCDDTKEIEEVPIKQLKEQKKQKLNQKQDLYEQVEYLDIVSTKIQGEVTGIIVNQYVNADKAGTYIVIQTPDNNLVRVQNSDINSIRKEYNDKYKTPLTDIVIENDSIYLCRKSADKISAKEFDDKTIYVEVEKDSVDFVINRGDLTDQRLIVECYNTKDNADITLIPVSPTELKVKKEKKVYYTFTYKGLSVSEIKPLSDPVVSPNNTLRSEYSVENGVYALYRKSDKSCVLFEIKE